MVPAVESPCRPLKGSLNLKTLLQPVQFEMDPGYETGGYARVLFGIDAIPKISGGGRARWRQVVMRRPLGGGERRIRGC
jgi:hypothetical protein